MDSVTERASGQNLDQWYDNRRGLAMPDCGLRDARYLYALPIFRTAIRKNRHLHALVRFETWLETANIQDNERGQ